jgi:hypothetical protein
VKTFTIYSIDPTEESDLMARFIQWQGQSVEIEFRKDAVKFSEGNPAPCVFFKAGKVPVAVGFFQLVDWFRKERLNQI